MHRQRTMCAVVVAFGLLGVPLRIQATSLYSENWRERLRLDPFVFNRAGSLFFATRPAGGNAKRFGELERGSSRERRGRGTAIFADRRSLIRRRQRRRNCFTTSARHCMRRRLLMERLREAHASYVAPRSVASEDKGPEHALPPP